MKIAVLITRSLLGLVFFAFGILYFLHVFKMPHMTGAIAAFHNGLEASGYFFPFLKITETVCGFFLLINRYTLAFLMVLFPVTLNILLYHVFMDASGIIMALVLMVLHLFLFYAYRKNYTSVLAAKAEV